MAPVTQRRKAVDRRQLADTRRTDRHRIHRLRHLRHQGRRTDQGTDTVAGQAEDLGEAIEVDKGPFPVRVLEQIMRCRIMRHEIAIGLIEDEGDAARFRQIVEPADRFGRIDGAGRIIGRDQQQGAGSRIDRRRHLIEIGNTAIIRPEGDMAGTDALHVEPHLVIEVIGQRQNDVLAGLGQRQCGQAIGLIAAGGDQDILITDLAAINA